MNPETDLFSSKRDDFCPSISAPTVSASAEGGLLGEHFVQFYESDEALVTSMAEHIGSSLGLGEAAIVIATPEHSAALAERLTYRAFDLNALKSRGLYVTLDAAQTLTRLMSGDLPDPMLFEENVGTLVARMAKRRRLRAFGEMVALLWAQGNQEAAFQLEKLWNSLGRQYCFSLLCAYPIAGFDGSANSTPMLHICDAHTRVLPTESFKERPHDPLREVALLQQRARSLEQEIEDRKKIEQALHNRERELTDLLENASEAIHQVADDGRILWANRAEIELLGYQPEEYIGRHIAEFHADREVICDILGRLSRGESLREYEARLKHKDGSLRHVAINSNVCWDGEKFRYTRCFTRDITDRKRSAEALERMVGERTVQLRETIAQLEAFSYSISHDLRSPLRTMHSYALALLEDYSSALPTEGIHFLQRIEKAATRLDQLTRDILAFSKVANGDIQLKAVALEPLIENLLEQHPGLDRARCSIQLRRPLHRVMGHEAYLTQCITNLLENALKFVPEGTVPHICIGSELVGDKVKVAVRDNGIGIAVEHRSRLFQIFGRVHAEQRFPGTGIGLALIKKAITRMNGEVGFDSEPGQGSCFWFVLPSADCTGPR